MRNMYLTKYSVKGIKILDKLVTLSFYKGIIDKSCDTTGYNVKAIYGMNGSGKSAIVASVDIMRNILLNAGYLSNPIVQRNLDEMINKASGELFMEAEFIYKLDEDSVLFRYSVLLKKSVSGTYEIASERLFAKKATSRAEMRSVMQVENGTIIDMAVRDEMIAAGYVERTKNLLSISSICALSYGKGLAAQLGGAVRSQWRDFSYGLPCLLIFAASLHVYMDQADDHTDYLLTQIDYLVGDGSGSQESILRQMLGMDTKRHGTIFCTGNVVAAEGYEAFAQQVKSMLSFIRIYKPELVDIEIDKKINSGMYVCDLIMVYADYKISAEFESTGIKKLIKLYAYFREMVEGGIVFIDELDSNLHDVYLCALLEYVMGYGRGQLVFTTHNVGPMDVLRSGKKSIDFLTLDREIVSWTTSGNYSPSKLYRNGMITGSPFNVDSIDFIAVFGDGEDDSWDFN